MSVADILTQLRESSSDETLLTPVHIDFDPPTCESTTFSDESLLTPYHIDFDPPTIEKPKKKARKTKTIKKYCSFKNCKNNSQNSSVKFFRLQKRPDLPANATKNQNVKYYHQINHRDLQLSRCGLPKMDTRKELRICSAHATEKVKKTVTFAFNEQQLKETYEFTVPVSIGVSSSLTDASGSKGVAKDRANKRILDDVNSTIKKGRETKNPVVRLKGEVAEWAKTCQQLAEENHSISMERDDFERRLSGESSEGSEGTISTINASVARSAGLFAPSSLPSTKKYHPVSQQFPTVSKTPSEEKKKERKQSHCLPPIETPDSISDKEVHRRTGFVSLNDMLYFIIVACNADIEKISQTTSNMTWFEEWMLYFEIQYSKSLTRWEDVAHPRAGYGVQTKVCREVFRLKLMDVISA